MSDEDLFGYLFDLLPIEDRAAVAARLELDPELAARLAHLRRAVRPVLAVAEFERDNPPEPAPGLALRAIARVAQHVVEHEPRPAEPESREPAIAAFLRDYTAEAPRELEFDSGTRAKVPGSARRAPPVSDGPEPAPPGRRFRADLIVAAGIAFLGFGLITSGIAKARHQQRVYACQNSLRTLHTGLSGYADSDPQGRYPQIDPAATAGTFAASLGDQGHLPAGYRPGCPAADSFVAYTYTLGFHEPDGRLLGLRRPGTGSEDAEHDTMPISADFPTSRAAPGDGPVSPHGSTMNVLFVGGNVRPTTSPFVGPNGDDIYRNLFGHVGAGANRSDAVLGRPGDRP